MLEQIIGTMNEAGIDTDSLIGVPEQFVQAISKTHNFLDAFFTLFRENDPDFILKKLDNVLIKSKKILVFVVEDLDRNESQNFILSDIFATLMRVKKVTNLFLILTGFPHSGKENRVDFQKLCDYVEDVGSLLYEDKLKVLVKIAEYHNKKYEDDVQFNRTDFPNAWVFHENRGDTSEDQKIINLDRHPWGNDGKYRPYREVIMDLIKCPRSLKCVVRGLNVAWETLHGECDYMELLDLMILKYSEVPIFDFIRENIYELRDYTPLGAPLVMPPLFSSEKRNLCQEQGRLEEQNDNIKAEQIKNDATLKSLDGLKEKFVKEYAFNKDDLDIMLDTLFPEKDSLFYQRSARRVCNNYPVDYFERIITEYIPDNQRDQEQLVAIRDWNKSKDKEKLLDLILSGDIRKQWIVNKSRLQCKNLSNAEHWQLVESAIDRLHEKMVNIDANLDVVKEMANWINFTFVNFVIEEPAKKIIASVLTHSILVDFNSAAFDSSYDDISVPSCNNDKDEIIELYGEKIIKSFGTDKEIERNFRVVLEKVNKFFAYYAIIALCFDDNGQKNKLFVDFFEGNLSMVMKQLSEYDPPIDAIYENDPQKIIIQGKIDKVKQAVKMWLDEHP